MKTIISLLAATMLIAGAGVALADQQGSDEAANNALSHQLARGEAYGSARPVEAYGSARSVRGPFNSAGPNHEIRVYPDANQNTIDFQAQGKN